MKIFLLLFSLLSFNVLGQTQSIKGKLVDQNTGQPIPFVHIWIPNSNLGTISGLNGDFSFNDPNLDKTQEVRFSAIGYESLMLKIHEFSDLIFLTPEILELNPFTVFADDYAYTLVLECIKNIPHNYSQLKEIVSGIQAEMVSEEASFTKPLYIAEAKIDIFKNPYPSKIYYQDRINESRVYLSETYDSLGLNFYSEKPSSYNYDVVYNLAGPLNIKRINSYDFKIAGSYFLDGEEVVIVNFNPNKKSEYFGELHILEESKALIFAKYQNNKFDFNLFDKLSNTKSLNHDILVNYKKNEGLFRLSDYEHNYHLSHNRKQIFLKDVFFAQEIKKGSEEDFLPDKKQDNVFFLLEASKNQTYDWEGFLSKEFSVNGDALGSSSVCRRTAKLFDVISKIQAEFGVVSLKSLNEISTLSFDMFGSGHQQLEIKQRPPLIGLKQSLFYQIFPKINLGFSTWNSFKKGLNDSYILDLSYSSPITQIYNRPLRFNGGIGFGLFRTRFDFLEPNVPNFMDFLEENRFRSPSGQFLQRNSLVITPLINLEYQVWKKSSLVFGIQNNQIITESYKIHFREESGLFRKKETKRPSNMLIEKQNDQTRAFIQNSHLFVAFRFRFI